MASGTGTCTADLRDQVPSAVQPTPGDLIEPRCRVGERGICSSIWAGLGGSRARKNTQVEYLQFVFFSTTRISCDYAYLVLLDYSSPR
jgi:hypothetical protein